MKAESKKIAAVNETAARLGLVAAALFSLLSVSGCSSGDSTSSAESAAAVGGDGGGQASGVTCTGTFESVERDIFEARCSASGCHTQDGPAAGLSLVGPDVQTELLGAESGTCNGWLRVAPGEPENSLLWHKLYADTPPCGGQTMPVGEHLSAIELSCVREWIENAPAPEGPQCETCGGSVCVDLATSSEHCGDCGTACPSGSACIDSQCECSGSLIFCDGRCVDDQSNTEHCGGCGTVCAAGALCNVGECVCPAGLTECSNACADLQSDSANCGSCGNACSSGQVCLRGSCADGCGDLTQCGGACVDTQTSVFHCGACDAVCPSGASCVGGSCQCPAGTSVCDGQCINTTSDPQNCGACGNACSGDLVCEAGQCQCAGGGLSCGGRCVDEQTDPDNCGACGNVCGAGQTCEAGTCTCADTGSISFQNDVQPIFTANCATRGCHSGLRPQEGLDLSPGNAYGATVGVATTQCSGRRVRVSPGDPSQSYLMNKLLGKNICTGSQMPKAGTSLSQSDLDTIGAWICAGAANN